MNCPHCGTDLPPNARFCMNCGKPVTLAASADRAAALAEKTRGPAHLSGERKVTTALFADVVGSTTLAEQMDPEDWTTIMNGAFERLSAAVERYNGMIVRLLGDALLALFGAPQAHEDDPARAIHASLDMLKAAEQYAEDVQKQYGIPFAIRIGINTGPVVVGAIGSDVKYEYTAMGDAVNLAARMQSAARPMTVLISENTYRYIAPLFESIDLGPIEVKGKSEPVRVYEIRAAKAEPGRIRGLVGLESPMVGRNSELSTLRSAVQDGAGRIVLISGEAGLGKSRLINEWKASTTAATEGPTMQWAEGQCLSYGQGLAYHLVLDLLRSLIGVPAAASESETRAALQSRTEDLFDAGALDVFPYLAHLLSLHLTGEALDRVQQLDPQALQGRYLGALRQMIQAIAATRPLGMILEDIHWADPSSVEMFSKLMPLVAESSVMFCFVTRPDPDAPGWKLVTAARENYADRLLEVELGALSEDDSRQLVSNLLEIEALPENIRSVILKKAEGNPFFVEEVIRMLIDRGAIRRHGESWVAEQEIENIEIPDNLQGLLLARIDRLPEDVKYTLRVASVIGRQFPVTVLEQVLSEQSLS
jgi:class 3 adenylate cyclase